MVKGQKPVWGQGLYPDPIFKYSVEMIKANFLKRYRRFKAILAYLRIDFSYIAAKTFLL